MLFRFRCRRRREPSHNFITVHLLLSEMEIVVYVCYDVFADPSPAQVRGRPKYSTYQNFKGRKSNSMMNLYGKTLRSLHENLLLAGCRCCSGHEVLWFLYGTYYLGSVLLFCW